MPNAGRIRGFPTILPVLGPIGFPDPNQARPAEGLLAVGGDLSAERLVCAYENGIFPWYDEASPILWWSPDPRTILRRDDLHVSRSLGRRIRQGKFSLSVDRAFREVVAGCADRSEGTWILPEMIQAYFQLHQLGFAHSFEVWDEHGLAGGLYGIHRGGLFAAESMFFRTTDASKLALVAAVRSLFRLGVTLFDVQLPNPHLMSLGATLVPRSTYLAELAQVRARSIDFARIELSWAE